MRLVRSSALGAVFVVGTGDPGVAQALSQTYAGPVIEEFGAVYPIADPDFPTPTDRTYRAVFDVSVSPSSAVDVNPRIETLARFLNMHGQAGVPSARMQLALVLHGEAGKDALNHGAYSRRFGTQNPNVDLLRALQEAGVDVYLCGQTASHRGFEREELAAPVQMALSAMTVLVTLQAQGYQLIAF